MGWIVSIILFAILLLASYGTSVAFKRISKGMYDLCLKANEEPEPILKKYGLLEWLE